MRIEAAETRRNFLEAAIVAPLFVVASKTSKAPTVETSSLKSEVRFFIEEHPEQHGTNRPFVIQRILSPQTCEFLEKQGWGICLATIELDSETAKVIKRVNTSFPHLPVTLWVVNEEIDGYWTNRFNIPETRKRTKEVMRWVAYHDLRIDSLGFDLETPIDVAKAHATEGLLGLTRKIVEMKRKRQEHKLQGYSPEKDMEDLLSELRKEGIPTESYEYQKPLNLPLLGILQAQNFDLRFTLVYTSVFPKAIQTAMLGYGMKAGTFPALGNISSTGIDSGRRFEGSTPKLHGKKELTRDIAYLAAKGVRENRDYLEKLRVFALTDLQVALWTVEALARVRP